MATITDKSRGSSAPLDAPLIGVGFVLAVAVCAVAWPLATYTLSLAAFGLAHVLSELRFVHRRYGARVHSQLAGVLVALLLGIVLLRISAIMGVLDAGLAGQLEVGVALMLGIVVLPMLGQRHPVQLGVGILVCAALAAGLLVSAMHTLLVLAILHNFTPIGFLADATEGARRRRMMALCAVVFLLMPVLIATGLPFDAASEIFGIAAPEASLLPVGPLAEHLGAYLPPEVHGRAWATHAFSAVVFTQCMHYAIVIHVLPRLNEESGDARSTDAPSTDAPSTDAKGTAVWTPRISGFTLFLIGAGLVWLAAFVWDFKLARRLYGVAAAVHAWVEIPILMIALLGVWPMAQAAEPESSDKLPQ